MSRRRANGVRFEALADIATLPGVAEHAGELARALTERAAARRVREREAEARAADMRAIWDRREGLSGNRCDGANPSTPGQGEAQGEAGGEEIRDAQGRLVTASVILSDPDGRMEAARRERREAIRAAHRESARSMAKARKAVARRMDPQRRPAPVRDSWAWLAARASLPDPLIEAGLDIDRILTAVEAGVMAASDPDTWASGGVAASGMRGAPQFMAIEGYCDRYLPWTRTLLAAEFRRGGQDGRAVMAVVVAVVRDGRSLAQIDAEVGVRKGTGMGLLCDGLRVYADIAGWR